MNRVQKYKESLHKFIKDKSCLSELCEECMKCSCVNCKLCKSSKVLVCEVCMRCECFKCKVCCKEMNCCIYDIIVKNDSIYSILFLTIMNNQNKKNHISVQGYYVAVCIEFLCALIYVIECGKDMKLVSWLVMYVNKSLQLNMGSIKGVYVAENTIGVMMKLFGDLGGVLKGVLLLGDIKLVATDKDYDLSVCEFAIGCGWVMGNGSLNEVDKLKNSAKCFATIYRISKDFENLERDIRGNVGTNYVLNYGLQEGYEEFMNNKQLFISDLLLEDIYSNTIKEIIDMIEVGVDEVIEFTSPDLKSVH